MKALDLSLRVAEGGTTEQLEKTFEDSTVEVKGEEVDEEEARRQKVHRRARVYV